MRQVHDQVILLFFLLQKRSLVQNRLQPHFIELILRFLHDLGEHDRLLLIGSELRCRSEEVVQIAKRLLNKEDRVQEPDRHRQAESDQEQDDPRKFDPSAAVRPDPVPQISHVPVQPREHQNHIECRLRQVAEGKVPAQPDAQCGRRLQYFVSFPVQACLQYWGQVPVPIQHLLSPAASALPSRYEKGTGIRIGRQRKRDRKGTAGRGNPFRCPSGPRCSFNRISYAPHSFDVSGPARRLVHLRAEPCNVCHDRVVRIQELLAPDLLIQLL